MKSVILLHQSSHPNSHKLRQLNTILCEHGVTDLTEKVFNDIQCPAEVRYSNTVTMEQAVRSQHSAIAIAIQLTKKLNHVTGSFQVQ